MRTLCVLCTTVSALGVLLQRSRRAVANDAAFTRCCVPLCLHVDTDKLFGRLKGGQGVLQGMITQEAIAGDPWYWKEHACSAGLQGTLGVR